MPDVLLDSEATWQAYAWNVAGSAVNYDAKTDAQTNEWATAQFVNNTLAALDELNAWANNNKDLGVVGVAGVRGVSGMAVSTAAGDITLTPGSGGSDNVIIDGSTWPGSLGTAGYVLTTDGAGTLSWSVAGGGGSWATVLSVGAVSGATSPVISDGQELNSPDGASTNLPGSALVLRPGAGDGEGDGGALDLYSGTAGPAGDGGNVNLRPSAKGATGTTEGVVTITPAWSGDTSPFLGLVGSGANSAEVYFFAGDRNPNSNILADPGDIYVRKSTTQSSLWINQGTTTNNDSWVQSTDYVFEFPIELYGAVVDGVTDDTTAVEAARDAADAAGGGVVRFPSGTCYLPNGVSYDGDNDVWFAGVGWASIVYVDGASAIGFDLGDTVSDRTSDVRIKDMEVQGAAGTSHGIRMRRLHSSRLQNVRVRSFGGNGIETDRCYATWYDHVYSNNNTGHGFHAGPESGGNGNDDLNFNGCRFLANGGAGVYIEGSCAGLNLEADIEGNAVGLQIDGGTGNNSESLRIRCYFENQTGKNVSMGEDAGTSYLEDVEFRCVVNPGTVDAATNSVSLDRVRDIDVSGSHFNTCDFVVTSNTTRLHQGRNKWSGSSNPFGTAPVAAYRAGSGADLNIGFEPIGWDTRHRVGVPYDGSKVVVAANVRMSADAAGTQDDTSVGSAAVIVGANWTRIVQCAAGGGASMTAIADFDGAAGLTALASDLALDSASPTLTVGDATGSPVQKISKLGTGTGTLDWTTGASDTAGDYRIQHDASENLVVSRYSGVGWVSAATFDSNRDLTLDENLTLPSASPTLSMGDASGSPSIILDKDGTGSTVLQFSNESVSVAGSWRFKHNTDETFDLEYEQTGGWVDLINFEAAPAAIYLQANTFITGDLGDSVSKVNRVFTDGVVFGLQTATTTTTDDTAIVRVDNSSTATITLDEGRDAGTMYFFPVLDTAADANFSRDGTTETINGDTVINRDGVSGDAVGLYIAIKDTSTTWLLYGPIPKTADSLT